jgi:phosphoribosyl 1,2-cyclic phosphodiesterase
MNQTQGLGMNFWGVRGSAPTPKRENLGFGGNTSCVEIRGGGQIAIFDAGTGMRNLGEELLRQFPGQSIKVNVFLSHYHWDHIQGLPFFGPLYQEGNEITFHASEKLGPLRDRLRRQMSAPYFPVDFDTVAARLHFVEMDSASVQAGDLRVSCFPMHHPQGAAGFRVESPSGVVVYASDLEPGNAELDRVVRASAEGAGALIYDSQFTPEEYGAHPGWGHSHWREAAAVARDAQVEELILFHHDPSHDDTAMSRIEEAARGLFERTTAAREIIVPSAGGPGR